MKVKLKYELVAVTCNMNACPFELEGVIKSFNFGIRKSKAIRVRCRWGQLHLFINDTQQKGIIYPDDYKSVPDTGDIKKLFQVNDIAVPDWNFELMNIGDTFKQ